MALDYKKNFIIINYPSGAFGSFLSHCLYKSANVCSEQESAEVFDSQGAAHLNQLVVFKNFHTYNELSEWSEKNISDRINYLEKNLVTEVKQELQYILRIASPGHTNKLAEIFNPTKIVEIKVQPSMLNLLSDLILNKIYLNDTEDLLNRVPEFRKYSPKLYPLFSNQAAKFFIELTQNKEGDLVIDFEDFFNKERFLISFNRLKQRLDLTIEDTEIEKLYAQFEKANEKYFSMYKKEKVLK